MAAYVIPRVSGVSGTSWANRVEPADQVYEIASTQRIQPNWVTDATIYDMELSASSRIGAPKGVFRQYLNGAIEKQLEFESHPNISFKDGVKMLALDNYIIIP